MGLKSTLDALYLNHWRPNNARQIMLPDGTTAIGAAVTAGNNPAWGAWIDVALLAAVTVDTLIVGIVIDTPSATAIYTIAIGSCFGFANAAAVIAAGAPAIAAASRAEVRFHYLIVGAAGYLFHPVIMLPVPVLIPAGVGILARGMTVAGAETVNVSAVCLQNFI